MYFKSQLCFNLLLDLVTLGTYPAKPDDKEMFDVSASIPGFTHYYYYY